MPARLRKTHQEDVRAKIQTSQLINRLTDHALKNKKLENSQVRAIEVLLRKTLPDLQAVTLSGDEGAPLTVKVVQFGDDPNP